MIPQDAARVPCADRLDLVDAAYERPQGRNSLKVQRMAKSRLRRECCDHCLIRRACTTEGQAEAGAWG